MDSALNSFICWQFILFCLAISAITYVFRTIIDYVLNNHGINAKECKLWANLILPIFPVILGVIIALLAKQYPYPMDIRSNSGRIAFGLCAGLLSGLIWRIIKSLLSSKLKESSTIDSVSITSSQRSDDPK